MPCVLCNLIQPRRGKGTTVFLMWKLSRLCRAEARIFSRRSSSWGRGGALEWTTALSSSFLHNSSVLARDFLHKIICVQIEDTFITFSMFEAAMCVARRGRGRERTGLARGAAAPPADLTVRPAASPGHFCSETTGRADFIPTNPAVG